MALLQLHDGNVRELYESYEHLRERYGRQDDSWMAVADRMLQLLPYLEEVCRERVVWGLLSHYSLCLLSRRDLRSRPHVVVAADSDGYRVSYKMQPKDAPWPHASVEGYAASTVDAARFVALAMERSGGWSDDEACIEASWAARRGAEPSLSYGSEDEHDG